MDTLRFGVSDYPPWYYLKDDNTPGGILAPFYRKLLYFVLGRLNVTFVRVSNSQKIYCSDDGSCNDWLGNLQKGEIDLVNRAAVLDELENVGMNLTSVPIMYEDYCFFGNKQNVQVNLLKPGFFDFIHTFQTSFWFYLMILSFSIIALNGIILKLQENYLYIDTFWPQFGYLLGQNFIVSSSIQRKCFFLVFIAGQLLISKLLSASLRTGLVQRSEYVRLDSFADVIRHNFTLISSEISQCTIRLQSSEDKLARQIWKDAIRKVFKNTSPMELANYLEQDGLVFLSSLKACKAMKAYVCAKHALEENNVFFRVSERPIYKVKHGYLINKLNLKSRIVNGMYSGFESGIMSAKFLDDFFIKLQIPAASEASTSCMAMKDLKAKVHVVPISMGYFTIPLFIFTIGIGISYLAFICIYLIDLLKKYHRVNKIDLGSFTVTRSRFNS